MENKTNKLNNSNIYTHQEQYQNYLNKDSNIYYLLPPSQNKIIKNNQSQKKPIIKRKFLNSKVININHKNEELREIEKKQKKEEDKKREEETKKRPEIKKIEEERKKSEEDKKREEEIKRQEQKKRKEQKKIKNEIIEKEENKKRENREEQTR